MSTAAFNHNRVAKIDFDFTPLLGGISSIQKGVTDIKNLYRYYKELSTIESQIKYSYVDDRAIESIEKTLMTIDDTIDVVEEAMENTHNIFKKFLLNRILSKLATIEFVLSNKVADRIGENHKDKTV